MKTLPSGVVAILKSPTMAMADCYTFTLFDGTVLRYTTADIDLTDVATGHVFSSKGPLLERSKVKFSVGVGVDELDVALTAGPNDLVEGAPWLQALREGILDGAELQVDRAFMAVYGDTSAGLVTIFSGRIVECDFGRTKATLKANTHLELLNLQWPWRLYQAACSHSLFDARCKLAKAAYAVAGTVTSSPAVGGFWCSLTAPDAWYTFGTVTFTSGANAGESRSIKNYAQANGALNLTVPLGVAPAIGDAFLAYPGCDKQMATCKGKFANLPNFGGMPFVPVPETAV